MSREDNWNHIDDLMRRKQKVDEQEQAGQAECKKLKNDAQAKSNAIYEKVAALQKESSEIMLAAYKQIEYIEYNLKSCRQSIDREREVVMRAITKASLKRIEPPAFEHHEHSIFKHRTSLTPDAKWMQVFATIYTNSNTVNKYTLAAEIIPNGVSPDTIIEFAGYLSASGTRTGIRELGKFATIDRAKAHITSHAREKADSFISTVNEFEEEMQAAEPFEDIFDFRLINDDEFKRPYDVPYYGRMSFSDTYQIIEKASASVTILRKRSRAGKNDSTTIIVGITHTGDFIVEGENIDIVDKFLVLCTLRHHFNLPHLNPELETMAKQLPEESNHA